MSLRRRFGACALVVAMAGAAPPAAADRAAADFFVQRGEKALRAKSWAEAQDLFRKAMDEEAAHVPALYGLGDARYGAGDRAGALEAWKQVVATTNGVAASPPAGTELVARAKGRVADLEASDAAFAALLDRQVEALLALASRWTEKDPDVAVKALRDALKLRPGHAAATEALRGLGGTGTDEWTSVFDGTDMSGFLEPDPTVWKVANGVMTGDLNGGTYVVWTRDRYRGDFDLRVEARVTKGYTARRVFLLAGAMTGKYQATQAGVMADEMVIRETEGEQGNDRSELTHREPLAGLPPSYDVTGWTTYELQFRGTKVRFVVNGTLLAERPRRPARVEGQAGMLLQDARVEVRRFQVVQR